MSSVQQQLEALREEKENLDFRIAELERSAKWHAEDEARRAELQHKVDSENILRLRTDIPLVTSNSALVKLLDALTICGATPHSEKRSWTYCENRDIRMVPLANGISLPALDGETWPDGIISMSGIFSYNVQPSVYREPTYPNNTMIDFGLVYRDGICAARKGLVLKEGKLLQLVPEKKVCDSLQAWIAEMGQPTFGAARVRLPDPRTRHQKAQDCLEKLGSFHEKIKYLITEYKLKQSVNFRPSPMQKYEWAVASHERNKKDTKRRLAELNLEAPGAGRQLIRWGNYMKTTGDYMQTMHALVEGMSEEDRYKQVAYIWNKWKSYLYVKGPENRASVVAETWLAGSLNGVYYCEGGVVQKWAPQGPTQVFLAWRGQEIPFNV